MKLSEYLLFAALLIPTILVVLAAIVSLAAPVEPQYQPQPPFALASSTGLYPAEMTTDE